MRVRPDPRVFRGDAALRYDCGRLHEDSACAARRETLSARPNLQAARPVSAWHLSVRKGRKITNANVYQVPVRHVAVIRAELAYWRLG